MKSREDLEYDPERKLWRPGRRSFLFMLGAAAGGLLVPKLPLVSELSDLGPWNVGPLTEKTVLAGYKDYADRLVETFSRDRVFAPFERDISPFREKPVFPFEIRSD